LGSQKTLLNNIITLIFISLIVRFYALFYALFFTCLVYLTFSTSCSKLDGEPIIIDSGEVISANVWQCKIDGINYEGIVDTSFLNIVFGNQTVDSVIVCTDVSHDKKARIKFKLSINRTLFTQGGVNNRSNTYLVFDTAASNLMVGNLTLDNPKVNYKIDAADGRNFKISFNGNLLDQKGVVHTVIGNLKCKLFTGNKKVMINFTVCLI